MRLPLQPVDYTMPDMLNSEDLNKYLNGDKKLLEKNLKGNLNKKTKNWEQEQEYRFMFKEGSDKVRECFRVPIFASAVKAIYFGMQIEPDALERLKPICFCNFPKAKLYSADKSIGKLQLEFKEIKNDN